MDDRRKVTAALSAVLHFIRTEQEALATPSTLPRVGQATPVSVHAPVRPFKPWGISGRQAQMQMRNLMLMRTFKKTR